MEAVKRPLPDLCQTVGFVCHSRDWAWNCVFQKHVFKAVVLFHSNLSVLPEGAVTAPQVNALMKIELLLI